MSVTTLNDIIKKHPEYADLPVVIYREDGEYDWVGASGSVYDGKTCSIDYDKKKPIDGACEQGRDCETCKYAISVLVFAGN